MRLNPLLLAAVIFCAPVSAFAEVRALLIGVSDYLVLEADLKGPSQDVALMAEVLVARGVAPSAVRSLASQDAGLPAGVANDVPTRAAILDAMQQMAAQSQPGDTLIFYFSGHGAQVPDASGDEGGGPDEAFLPADAAGWDGAQGGVQNAILDDELQIWAQDLLSRGVRLVGLIDACHSATGFRAVGGTGNARSLSEADLGIPPEMVSAQVDAEPQAMPLAGEFVFLYSSQADQRSFEYPLGNSGLWHGEFTLRLAEELRRLPVASWGQLLAVTADAMVQGPVRQDPAGEGPLLDAKVFGEGTIAARYPLEQGRLRAGLLQGLGQGDEVALFAEAAGGQVLATLTLGEVGAREAALSGQVPEAARWAERGTPAPPPPLRVAALVRADPADGFDYAPWAAALPPAELPADLVPILIDGGLAFAGPEGVLDPDGPGSTPRVQILPGEDAKAATERVLDSAGHALRLRKLLAAVAGRSLTGGPALQVTYERRAGSLQGAECDGAAAGGAAAFDATQPLAPCDQLWMHFTNVSGGSLDVSALYFNADFTVSPVWPLQGLSNRLAPGESARAGVQITPGSPAATEELVLLAVPVTQDSARVDLTRLVEPSRRRGLGGAVENWFEVWLEGDTQSRGFTLKPAALLMQRQRIRLRGAD